jgi:hypothetical protein
MSYLINFFAKKTEPSVAIDTNEIESIQIEIYTKNGTVIVGKTVPHTENTYQQMLGFMKELHHTNYLYFETEDDSVVYLTKDIITDSIIRLRKNYAKLYCSNYD